MRSSLFSEIRTTLMEIVSNIHFPLIFCSISHKSDSWWSYFSFSHNRLQFSVLLWLKLKWTAWDYLSTYAWIVLIIKCQRCVASFRMDLRLEHLHFRVWNLRRDSLLPWPVVNDPFLNGCRFSRARLPLPWRMIDSFAMYNRERKQTNYGFEFILPNLRW